MAYFTEIQNTLKEVFRRLRKRDFSGYAGLTLKNSIYQISINFVAKIGALIFTVILARLLMPELFGLYSLALSTIFIFVSFSDFGINQTLTRFASVSIGKNNLKKAKGYFVYLSKIKLVLILFSILLLTVSANFISNNYYQKPLFLALIFGSFYILFSGIAVMLKASFEAINDFKIIFYQEVVFQLFRILVIPLAIIFIMKNAFSDGMVVSYIILGLSLSYLISFIFFLSNHRKISFFKEKAATLPKTEKTKLKKFILAIFFIILSGVFFSYIDKIMLGYFVEAEFIGYYSAVFSLISAASILISFSPALLPIFSRLNKKKLSLLYKKTIGIVSIFSILLAIFVLVFSSWIIRIVFGENYLPAIGILRLFSIMLILIPVISLLATYLVASGKPEIISKFLILSTIMNILLNYILISKLVIFGQIFAVYGSVAATIISNAFYLSSLVIYKNKTERSNPIS